MSIIKYCLLFSLVAVISGCGHRTRDYRNQFEVIGNQRIVPEPVDKRSRRHIPKEAGYRDDIYNRFGSEERVGFRTRMAQSIRPRKANPNWETTYTNSVESALKANPGEVFKRTGQWPLRYTLDTGDRLRVIVYSQRTLTRTYTVDDSGYISVPLVGQVKARGVSTKDVQNRITSRLKAKYLRDPKVSVEVVTYRPFFVLGQVQSSGQYPYVVGMTAEVATAIAGGFTSRANERKFRVSRIYKGQRYTLLVSKNFPIFPGDTVYVQERLF